MREAVSRPTDMAMQIGINGRGKWVVRDAAGRRGGVFAGRREALRFALSANGHRPDAVVMVPWPLELMPQGAAVEAGLRAA